MSSAGILMVVVVATTILLLGCTAVRASVNLEEVFHICGLIDHADSDDQSLMDLVSRDLIQDTPRYSFNHYDEIELGFLNVYGHAWCRTPTSSTDCVTCLHAANIHRLRDCNFVKGFQIMLKDCYMRIEEYDFKYDNAVMA